MNQPPKKRRRFSFSLRTLMVFFTACCLFLGWWTNSAHRQKRAVAWVREQEGIVYYDWQYSNDEGRYDRSKELEPNWMRDKLGVDYFHTVEVAYISDKINDLSPLADLENLGELFLYDTQVSDLSPLAELKNLNLLYLFGTQVSKEEIRKLKKALPYLKVER